MFTCLLNTIAFLGLLAAFIALLFFCWGVPRGIVSLPEGKFLGFIPLPLNDIILFSVPTLLVGGAAWLFAWWMLMRDSRDGEWPVPQIYLASFTVIGVIATVLIAWRVIYYALVLINGSMQSNDETVPALIGGIIAFVPSVGLWLYHGMLWRQHRKYYRRLGE